MITLLKKILHGSVKKADSTNYSKTKEYDKQKYKNDPEQLFQAIPIENTPFAATKVDNKWFLAMGKYRLEQPRETIEEVLQDSEDASWMRLMTIINIMIQEDKQLTKIDENIKNHTKQN